MSHIHINYGRARRKSEPDETCMYCERHAETMAYTYFGAPVCGACWDSNWRKTEDGECDPPFNEIHNQVFRGVAVVSEARSAATCYERTRCP